MQSTPSKGKKRKNAHEHDFNDSKRAKQSDDQNKLDAALEENYTKEDYQRKYEKLWQAFKDMCEKAKLNKKNSEIINNTLKDDLSQAEEDKTKLQEKLSLLREQISKNEPNTLTELKNKQVTIDLKKKVASLEGKICDMEKEIEAVAQQNLIFERKYSASKQINEKLNAEISTMNDELAKCKQTIDKHADTLSFYSLICGVSVVRIGLSPEQDENDKDAYNVSCFVCRCVKGDKVLEFSLGPADDVEDEIEYRPMFFGSAEHVDDKDRIDLSGKLPDFLQASFNFSVKEAPHFLHGLHQALGKCKLHF